MYKFNPNIFDYLHGLDRALNIECEFENLGKINPVKYVLQVK